mmetsp:Transcript_22859/g.47703  ORF Transcript_22859/g.47703 Transcript_22859/m.47703 type:complete len:367 (+) Transcript_22859:849-1949(+)
MQCLDNPLGATASIPPCPRYDGMDSAPLVTAHHALFSVTAATQRFQTAQVGIDLHVLHRFAEVGHRPVIYLPVRRRRDQLGRGEGSPRSSRGTSSGNTRRVGAQHFHTHELAIVPSAQCTASLHGIPSHPRVPHQHLSGTRPTQDQFGMFRGVELGIQNRTSRAEHVLGTGWHGQVVNGDDALIGDGGGGDGLEEGRGRIVGGQMSRGRIVGWHSGASGISFATGASSGAPRAHGIVTGQHPLLVAGTPFDIGNVPPPRKLRKFVRRPGGEESSGLVGLLLRLLFGSSLLPRSTDGRSDAIGFLFVAVPFFLFVRVIDTEIHSTPSASCAVLSSGTTSSPATTVQYPVHAFLPGAEETLHPLTRRG